MLTEMVANVGKHLKKGSRIRIPGLGILQVRKRAARMGRNPATGRTIKIKASKKIAFRESKDLKEAVVSTSATGLSLHGPRFGGVSLFELSMLAVTGDLDPGWRGRPRYCACNSVSAPQACRSAIECCERGFAEETVQPASSVMKLPDALGFEAA